jgi:SAM-dependent methyltransferase
MREIFPREAAADPEPFTGERLTASVHGQVELEHYHRYLFSRGFCRDRDVLDVASGEGYGAAHLAQVARRVVGVEYSGPTACNATRNFPRANLCFVQADARSLPVGNASVDVVTSFETIEHFDRQEDFVAEVRRVLRPDGCFIVSTPDRDVYSPPGSTPNPFHVHEFDRTEFLDLLHRYFRYVSLIRQRPMLASALIPEEPASVAPVIFERVEDAEFASDTALPAAPYLIAIASEVVPKLAPVSLLIERGAADNVRSADQEAELVRLRLSEAKAREEAENERQAAEAERATARAAVETAQKSVDQAEADAKAAAVTLAHTRAALVQANSELERISHSLWQFLRQYLARIRRRFVH